MLSRKCREVCSYSTVFRKHVTCSEAVVDFFSTRVQIEYKKNTLNVLLTPAIVPFVIVYISYFN
jgi:hypothetical protein